ncbi:2OG-Fe(II) oxygenase [Myxococcota bacterium]|nr:2OG-Fe(II) oxygenase [Myxococcota bacterium]
MNRAGTNAGAEPLAEDVLNYRELDTLANRHRDDFSQALPFPHVVLDDFLPGEFAREVAREFDQASDGWDHYRHYNEDKTALTHLDGMPPRTRALVDALISRPFVEFVQRLTGLDELLADPELDGAGLHKVPRGGFLNVHADFLSHTQHHDWSRQINLLLYFNEDWQPKWNGDLEFWDSTLEHCVTKIPPLFNRCVLFHTTAHSFHGHPAPLACPESVERKSIALYYFRQEASAQPLTSTDYRSLPGSSLRERLLVAADRTALRLYSFIRRHTKLSDGIISRFLKRL